MKTFIFKLYTKTRQGQEFLISAKTITAKNVDDANKAFNRLDLPFHTFCTIQLVKSV